MEYDFGDDDDEDNRSSSKHYAFGDDDDDDDDETEDVDVDGTDTDPAEGTDEEEPEDNDTPSNTVQDVKGRKVKKKYVDTPSNSDGENEKSSGSSKNNIDSRPSKRNKYKKKKTKTGKQKAEKKKIPVKRKLIKKPKVKKIIKSVMPVPPLNDLEAYLQFYHPPEWLLSVEPRKFPYFPQIMDEVRKILSFISKTFFHITNLFHFHFIFILSNIMLPGT